MLGKKKVVGAARALHLLLLLCDGQSGDASPTMKCIL